MPENSNNPTPPDLAVCLGFKELGWPAEATAWLDGIGPERAKRLLKEYLEHESLRLRKAAAHRLEANQ